LLEDLGDDLFAQLAETSGDMEQSLYEAAVDFLADLHKAPLLPGLVPFDAQAMTKAVDLASTWYAQGGTGDPHPELLEGLADSFRDMPALTEVMILRDFHAENLIWLPDRQGHARVGVLDFQDALLGHRAYDLGSLLRDARRDVPEALEDAMIERYIAASGVEGSAFRLAYATLCVQRNLRILGIFARLSLAESKARYLDFIPRVWGHVISGLNHPDLANLKQVVLECIPNPSPAHLTRIRPA
jgi:aminoglycoside/choline kinase family phosphotransferase